MGVRVTQILADLGLREHKVLVDSKNIYLQIKNGDAYLYEIIARSNRGGEGERV